jgi:multiple sugar transport system substrate-binding protein
MKIVGAALAATTLAALLSSCAGNGSGDGTTTLTFWDGNAIPERTEVWNSIIADFEKANPDITIDYVGLPQDSSGQKFDNAVATGSAPDIGVVPRGDVASYQAQGALVPLDDYLAQSPLADQITSTYLDQTRASSADGKLYALPTHALLDTIWYRPQLFEAAGLTAPDTWDEFYTAADRLTNSAEGQFGFTIRGGEGGGYQMLADLYAASGIDEFFDADGATTLNDPKNVEALEKLVALYGKNTPEADVTNPYPQMLAQFQGGQIAMMQHNIGSYPTMMKTFDDSQVKAMPLPRPAADAGHVVVTTLLPSIAIYNPEHADASWKFLEFVLQADNDSALAETAAGIPTNIEAQSADWVVNQPAIQMALDVVNDPEAVTVQAPTYLPQYAGIIKTEVEPMFQKVLLGQATAEELLDHWAELVDEAQQKYEDRQSK